MISERWRQIEGWPYSISSQGRVRSDRTDKILKPDCNSTGYLRVRLQKDGATKRFFVHILVAYAFVGPRPEGLQCAHMDGNKTHNMANNLGWVTAKENQSHRIIHGTDIRGEKQHLAKLTEASVKIIRVLRLAGRSYQEIADIFDVNQSTVMRVIQGKTWAHVS